MPRLVKKNRPASTPPRPRVARAFDRGLLLAILLVFALPAVYVNYFPCGLGLFGPQQEYWECESAAGSAEYQYKLGKIYYTGAGIPQDVRRARNLFSWAALQGYAPAQNALGVLYHNYYDIDSQQIALAWFRAAAARGNRTAQYHLGEYYYNGDAVPQDYRKSALWFEAAATAGYHPAQYKLAHMHQTGLVEAFAPEVIAHWYREAAEQGNHLAAYELGQIYNYGYGKIPPIPAQAYYWHQQAAQKDVRDSEFYLGYFYEHGYGIPRNYHQALQWYTRAANKNHAQAQNNLGRMYKFGDGVPPDKAQARQWFAKAAQQKNRDALYNLGLMYRYDRENQDAQTSLKYIETAANLGYPPAQNHLALMYRGHGDKLKPDKEKSLWWLQQAAEKNYPPALEELIVWHAAAPAQQEYWVEKLKKINNETRETARRRLEAGTVSEPGRQFEIGNNYEQGIYPMQQNIEQAEKWYKRAADQEHREAQFRLAEIYYKERFPQKNNYPAAIHWYKRAASQGHVPALYMLGEVYYNGIGTVESKAQAYLYYSLYKIYGADREKIDKIKTINWDKFLTSEEKDHVRDLTKKIEKTGLAGVG